MQKTKKIIEDLQRLYDEAVATLQADIAAFAKDGTIPPDSRRQENAWCYPELRLRYRGGEAAGGFGRSFGRLNEAGIYATTITKPTLFAAYLEEQLSLLSGDYDVEISVGRSTQEIPFPYVLDGAAGAAMASVSTNDLARHFPST